MKEKQVKSILIQWFVPFAVLIVVIFVMLINFSVSSRNKEFEEVENSLIATTESYALKFYTKLDALRLASAPLASFMQNYTLEDAQLAVDAAKAIRGQTDAYNVVFSDVTGMGLNHEGEQVSLKNTEYFEDIVGGSTKYTYVENDGFTDSSCVIASIPLYKGQIVKGFLLTYYKTADFANIIRKMEFDTTSYYAVVAQDGTVICQTGIKHALFADADFWNHILANCTNREEVNKAYVRMQNKISGMVTIQSSGSQDKSVIYSPIGINDWYMVIGINKHYVDSLQSREWKNTRLMIIKLIVSVVIFLGMLVVINIVSKIREVEKSKDLEDKADTDLLTGLNNKVATERKIKEYLAEYPNEQSVMFVLDIDNFKKINDTMGHAFGDEVLRTLGLQIRAEFRVSDIVGRTGGDEFMILLKNIKDDLIIEKEGRKVERFFRNFQAGEYVKYSATASIGAAVFPRDARDFESLYKAADRALYVAKKRGKNQLAFYGDDCTTKE